MAAPRLGIVAAAPPYCGRFAAIGYGRCAARVVAALRAPGHHAV